VVSLRVALAVMVRRRLREAAPSCDKWKD